MLDYFHSDLMLHNTLGFLSSADIKNGRHGLSAGFKSTTGSSVESEPLASEVVAICEIK